MAPGIDLEGRHVFVSGGNRGIGAATAKMAASFGARVSITYKNSPEAASAVVDAIIAAGGEAQAYRVSVDEEASVHDAVNEAVMRFGDLRGMVVSAGVFEHCLIEDMTHAFWDRTMSINMRGTVWCVKEAARHMRRHGSGGSVVLFSSTAGQSGGGHGASAYAVSKAGQIVFARCMAHELASDRIRVNTVAPAWTDTDMAKPHLDRIGRSEVAKRFPLGRIGKPEDAASAACYLLSDMAGFVTGSVHTVDGGMAMRG